MAEGYVQAESTDPLLVNINSRMMGAFIDETRQHIKELEPYQSELLDEYCSNALPKTLKDQKPRNVSWTDWLGRLSSDEKHVEFLKWHVNYIEHQQVDPEVQGEIYRGKQLYKSQVADAIKSGWLHEDAHQAIDKVDDVPVYIGDVFDTLMQERTAYYWGGRLSKIVIAGQIDPGLKQWNEGNVINNISWVLKHELNHAVLGNLGDRWLNEAVTEHIAQALSYDGKPEVIDPSERGKRLEIGRFYTEERELLAAVMQNGQENEVPAQLATLAYSAGQSSPCASYPDFHYAVDKLWSDHEVFGGKDSIVNAVSARAWLLERAYLWQGLSRRNAEVNSVNQTLDDFKNSPQDIAKLFGKYLGEFTLV
ncbi:MAG TPA: hypothetical protein VK534_01545 [Methylomirabilota bacterium]|nr:hypothetical protein [Methylomirabilota bacterium]